MPEVRIRAPVKASEDPRKVEKAVRVIFPDAVIQAGRQELIGRTDSLNRFRDLIWKAKILDAARRVLLGSLDEPGEHARFSLSKQAAYGGHVSFSIAEAPLGDLDVDVKHPHLEHLFKEIAPPTLRGRPVSEEEYERHLEKERRIRSSRKVVAVKEDE